MANHLADNSAASDTSAKQMQITPTAENLPRHVGRVRIRGKFPREPVVEGKIVETRLHREATLRNLTR